MTTPDGRCVSGEDAALDAVLAAWAARHSPSSEHLETVRRAILDEGKGAADAALAEAILPLEWWERFFVDLQAGMSRAASLDSVLGSMAANAA